MGPHRDGRHGEHSPGPCEGNTNQKICATIMGAVAVASGGSLAANEFMDATRRLLGSHAKVWPFIYVTFITLVRPALAANLYSHPSLAATLVSATSSGALPSGNKTPL